MGTTKRYMMKYGGHEICYDLEFKCVKHLNLSVKPDLSVYVSAPMETPKNVIDAFVKKKAPWILRHMKGFKETKNLDDHQKDYVSGETFKYLGRQYRLQVELTKSHEHVTMKSGYIVLEVKDQAKRTRKQHLVDAWFKDRAVIIFHDVLDRMYPLVETDVSTKPTIEIKLMKKRWGSCLRSKNRILLNSELIKAPKQCIEYVVLHELIHFEYKDHDRLFYEHLTVLMPDWKERKAILDEEVVLFV